LPWRAKSLLCQTPINPRFPRDILFIVKIDKQSQQAIFEQEKEGEELIEGHGPGLVSYFIAWPIDRLVRLSKSLPQSLRRDDALRFVVSDSASFEESLNQGHPGATMQVFAEPKARTLTERTYANAPQLIRITDAVLAPSNYPGLQNNYHGPFVRR
jgi:hypothetical protein